MKKVFNLFLLILLCFTLTQTAFAKTTKFVVLSDTHVKIKMDESGVKLVQTSSVRNLQKGVKMANGLDADFTVFLGDNIDMPGKSTLVAFAKIINKLNKPVYVTIGNYDVSQVMDLGKDEYFRLLNRFSHNRTRTVPCVKRMSSDLVFFYMDGVNQFIMGPSGYFKDAELMWLDKELKKYKNDKVIILQHFPVEEPRKDSEANLYKAEEYRKVLSRHSNVIALVSGHYHFENVQEIDGIMHISVPAFVESGKFNEISIEEGFNKKYLIKIKTHQID